MAPSLAHFPDLCLETIFKHVPQYDLLYSVGLVCKSWYKTRRTELNKRRRLVLFQSKENDQKSLNNYRMNLCSYGTDLIERVRRDDGSPWFVLESLEHFKFDALRIPCGSLSSHLVLQTNQFFSSLRNFSSITRLSVYVCTYSILIDLMQLIGHFSEHLIELKLKFRFFPNRDIGVFAQVLDDNVLNLFACLNSLQSIEHLKLDLIFANVCGNIILPPLSCLSRLTTFSFSSNGDLRLDDWIIASLNQYARNVNLIELDNMVNVHKVISQLHNQLVTKFTAMSLTDVNLFQPMIQRYDAFRLQFCSRFSSLTNLKLYSYFFLMPMTMLARCLSLLPQLVHLYVLLIAIPPVEVAQPGEDEMIEEEEEQDEHVQQAIVQVPSVRLLSLQFFTKSHHDYERLLIPEIFPNLQVLSLNHKLRACQECEIDFRRGGGSHCIEGSEPELARRIAECTRLARQPFRACANLHTIELVDFNDEYKKTLINFDEL